MIRSSSRRVIAALLPALLTASYLVVAASPAHAAVGPPATISNGTIELGIQPEGNLVVGSRGLAFLPTGNESLAPGCDCEGWGVADVGSGVTGYASESNGQANVAVEDFTTTATDATSVVNIAGAQDKPSFRVIHSFTPAAQTQFLYRLHVQVQNASTVDVTDLRYRRVMDWDTEPTAFHEFVTNEPGNATNLIHLSNDGFFTPDPLTPNSAADNDVDFYKEGRVVDYGPNDHGSLWDFSFGPLAAGATKDFTIFYGAAPTEPAALEALKAVNAEAFSLGQPNTEGMDDISSTDPPAPPASDRHGTPNTFIFAFEGIGGKPVFGGSKNYGYTMFASESGTFNFQSPFLGTRTRQGPRLTGPRGNPLNEPIVAGALTPSQQGYWQVGADGGVFTFGDAQFYGTLSGTRLNQPIVGIAATPTGNGYWLTASDGGVFAFGDAVFYGSLGSITLNKPVVGIASTPSGLGYWLAASDGGVFAFGDAVFSGSTGSIRLNSPMVGIAAPPSGGYWLVAGDGGVFAFGGAAFYGSTAGTKLTAPVVGIASTPTGLGYTMAGQDGGIFVFGDAPFLGNVVRISPPLRGPIVGIATI